MVRPYVFLEVLTKIKVVRHLIRRPMIFFPGYNAQGLRSYSQKTKWIQEKYAFLSCLLDCHEGTRRRKNTLSITFKRTSFLQYTTLNIFLFPPFRKLLQFSPWMSEFVLKNVQKIIEKWQVFLTYFRPLVIKLCTSSKKWK